jgi:ribosome-binding protein aMBF1 (putative translation factor)
MEEGYFYNFCEICGAEINDKKIGEIGDGECICRKCRGNYYNNNTPKKKTPIKKKNRGHEE